MKKSYLILLNHQANRLENMIKQLEREDIKIVYKDEELSKKGGGYLTIAYLKDIQLQINNIVERTIK